MRAVPLVLWLVACNAPYVTQKTYEEHLACLDHDGDGAVLGDTCPTTAAQDCDDDDPGRAPGLEEVPYDGIDNDCDSAHLDLVDVDGDRFPGIGYADWLARAGDPDLWPLSIDIAAPVDCNDHDASVNPGALDEPYDGIDQNCSGPDTDDYDQDGDGYEKGDGTTEPGGDCDDLNADIHPGVADDPPYDGVDQDCARDNDFDADGDGYMPTSDLVDPGLSTSQWSAKLTTYCLNVYPDLDQQSCWSAMYGGQPPIAAPTWGDCADLDAQVPAQLLTAHDVHPGAPDAGHDGVDADCNGSDDFDLDGDLYVDPTEVDARNAYVDFYEGLVTDRPQWCAVDGPCYDDPALTGDCDDSDGAVHPGVMEHLGDAIDQDCDSGVDTTPWLSGELSGWDNPSPPVVAENDANYLLATLADAVPATLSSSANTGIGLEFSPTSAFNAPIDGHTPMTAASGKPLGASLDLLASGDTFDEAYQYWNPGANGYLIARHATWNVNSYAPLGLVTQTFSTQDDDSDVDLVTDADARNWGLGCGAKTFIFTTSSPTWSKASGACGGDGSPGCTNVNYTPGLTCFIDPPASGSDVAVGTVCDGTGCTSYDLDAAVLQGTVSVSAAQPYAIETWTQVNQSTTWRAAVDGSGPHGVDLADATHDYTVLPGFTAHYAEAVQGPDGKTYVAAVVSDITGDGLDDVVLAYGDPAGAMTNVPVALTVDGATFDATGVSIVADASRVFVAVTGAGSPGNDAVAWLFVSP